MRLRVRPAMAVPLTAEVGRGLGPGRPVPAIHAVSPAGRITFGFSEDLDEAMADALEAMLIWMQAAYAVDKAAALALASPAVDLRITQVANEVWGVHAVLPDAALSVLGL